MGRIKTTLIIAVFLWGTSLAHAAPTRVVSLSVCTDQLVLALAKPDQIAALSRLASSREISAYAEEAAAYSAHNGKAEEILGLSPDLVVVDDWTPSITLAMLEKLRLPVLKLPTLQSLEELPPTLEKLAAALGREDQAGKILRDWPAGLTSPGSDAPLAAFYRPNGYSPGLETPQDSALSAAGWRNLSATLGMRGSQSLDLERFIFYAPDLWVQDVKPRRSFGLGDNLMAHPTLREVTVPVQEIALKSWFCVTPRTMEAVKLLETVRMAAKKSGNP